MTMAKLLPCPFCGAKALSATISHGGLYQCLCTDIKCGAGTAMEATKAKSEAAWNRRAPVQKGE